MIGPHRQILKVFDYFLSTKTIKKIRTFFVADGGTHNNFPFFNINFSYNDIASDVLTIAPGCKIKTEYGCNQMVTKGEQAFLRQ